MKVLVANIGSTSFKYRLYDMTDESQLAKGRIERIGEAESPVEVEVNGRKIVETLPVPDHAEAVRQCLKQLTAPETGCLADSSEVSAIGFKAVHGGRVTGVQIVTDEVLEAMEEMVDIAPAHNPPYIAAMRQLRAQLPEVPLVAAFETGFHATIPVANRTYAVPDEWIEEYQIRRFGFHGASHRFISVRGAELFGGKNPRIISCHLGGSSSLCAIADGKSRATSMGGSPQGGLPQNNRVGDFDPYLLPHLMKRTGKSCEEILAILGKQGGLLGLGGAGTDIRDIMAALDNGDEKAKRAIDVYVFDIRRYLGAYLVELGGADMLVFTGGIGENQWRIREMVCRNLESFGIILDPEKNQSCRAVEGCISTDDSPVKIYVIPANEEIIVARQTAEAVSEKKN
ncbi:MAG: acetate/propionate family kinase [Planctomycetia bacterium]|nr:acetate/propionate family kinase [Planctomycetia bacterium]